MHISYKTIFKEAWQLTKSHKALWILGIFSSFIALESVYEIILSQLGNLKNINIFYATTIDLTANNSILFNKYTVLSGQLLTDLPTYFSFIILGAIAIFFIWLAFVCQISIIKAVALSRQTTKLNIREIFTDSFNKFWPVLTLNILSKLITYAILIALSLPLIYALLTNSPLIFIANIIYFIIFTFLAVIISFITAYAINFAILKDLDIIEAFKKAWQLFKKNMAISFEVAFLLFLFKIVTLVIIISIFFIFFAPLVLALFLSLLNGSIAGIILISVLLVIIFTVISLFINSVFNVFYLASWTITFLKLTEDNFVSKVKKLISSFFGKAKNKYEKEIDSDKIKMLAEKEVVNISKKLENKYQEYKPIVKKEAKVLASDLKQIYKEYKPVAQKEAKIIAQKIAQKYEELEPKVTKQIKKTVKQAKKEIKIKLKESKAKKTKTQPKKKTKKTPTKKYSRAKKTLAKPKNKSSKKNTGSKK